MSEEDDGNGLSEASGGVSGESGPREGESVGRDSRVGGEGRVYGVQVRGRWRRARAEGWGESGGYELG